VVLGEGGYGLRRLIMFRNVRKLQIKFKMYPRGVKIYTYFKIIGQSITQIGSDF
jgi:hypothetical protein